MSQDANIREKIYQAFNRSKIFEKKGRLEESLEAMEKVKEFADNPRSSMGSKIVVRIGRLCNELAQTSDFVKYIGKAESIFRVWVKSCICQSISIDDQIIHLYYQTLSQMGSYQRSKQKHKSALRWYTRVLELLELSQTKKEIEIIAMFGRTRANISLIYLDNFNYKETIRQGEQALFYLRKEHQLRRLLGNEEKIAEMITVYVTVLYNIGFSEGVIGNSTKMKEMYRTAIEISANILPAEFPILTKIREVIDPISNSRMLQRKASHNNKLQSIMNLPPKRAFARNYSIGNLAETKKTSQKHFSTDLDTSTNKYFDRKTRKQLDLDSDANGIKRGLENISKQDGMIRRQMSDLRFRKNFKQPNKEMKDLEYVKGRIEFLKLLENHTNLTGKPRAQKKVEMQCEKISGQHIGNLNPNDEIEGLMSNITNELKKINSKKLSRPTKVNRTCTLAKSTRGENNPTKIVN